MVSEIKYDHVTESASLVCLSVYWRVASRLVSRRRECQATSRIKPICDHHRPRAFKTLTWLLSVPVPLPPSSVPHRHPVSLPPPMTPSSSRRPTPPPSAPASVSPVLSSPCSSNSSTTPPTHRATNAKHSPESSTCTIRFFIFLNPVFTQFVPSSHTPGSPKS